MDNRYFNGLWLILIAIVLILGKLGVISILWALFWPALIFLPALAFHLLYFNRTWPVGALIPGGILLTYSLIFFFCNWFGWHAMTYLWPGFIFGVAVGLYEAYYFDHRSSAGMFTAVLVLTAISVFLFVLALLFTVGVYFVALLLIVAGGAIVWLRRQRIV